VKALLQFLIPEVSYGPLRWSEEVKVEGLFLGEAGKYTAVDELAMVMPRQLPKHNLPDLADAEQLLEQIDESLG
jgi:hypothetical protein